MGARSTAHMFARRKRTRPEIGRPRMDSSEGAKSLVLRIAAASTLIALLLTSRALSDPTPSPPTIAPTSAPGKPTLGVQVPQTQNVGPPVELDECQPYFAGGIILGHLEGFMAKFTNDTNLTADVVEIQVLNAAGDTEGTIRDVGTFGPGVEVTHKYREGSGTITFSPLFSRVHVSCAISVVHFTDGTTWRAQAQPIGTYSHDETPSPLPSPS
jgi:hypothetical protein